MEPSPQLANFSQASFGAPGGRPGGGIAIFFASAMPNTLNTNILYESYAKKTKASLRNLGLGLGLAKSVSLSLIQQLLLKDANLRQPWVPVRAPRALECAPGGPSPKVKSSLQCAAVFHRAEAVKKAELFTNY